ncbi:MFS transporter [Marinomonas sp. TI.3.20]|uniref:MFS transporter n=1 Tax=Marinomonas sp. TI.3.20 TaxID=3121296 RepID=UPI00311EBF85
MLLLCVIYLAFISLGLPDAVLGASWPVMGEVLNASPEFAGVVALIISAGTVMSSLLATRMIHYMGIGKLVALSVLLTAIALIGFSLAEHSWVLALLAIPLGVGGGAVDAALNNFVAVHFKAKHMNYLHSFWGVGAMTGPLIMAHYLTFQNGWRDGYEIIAITQFSLVIVLFSALPLWKKMLFKTASEADVSPPFVGNMAVLKKNGVWLQLMMFFCYCAIESGTGLWAASFLTTQRSITAGDAAFWVAMYYMGITLGRFLCGAITEKMPEETLVRLGVIGILLGCIMLVLTLSAMWAKFGLILIGLGCAPIYPNTIHMTPKRFGSAASQAIISLSMAVAYMGIMAVPPLLGVVANLVGFVSFPIILLLLGAIILFTTERLRAYRIVPVVLNKGL